MRKFVYSVLLPLRRKKWLVAAMFVGATVHAGANALLLAIIGPVAKVLFGRADMDEVDLLEFVPASLGFGPWYFERQSLLLALPIALLLGAFLRSGGGYLFQRYSETSAAFVTLALRRQLFAKIVRAPYLVAGQHSAAEWMSMIINDFFVLQIRLGDLMVAFVRDLLTIIGCLGVLVWFDGRMVFYAFGFITAVLFFLGKLSHFIVSRADRAQALIGSLTDKVLDIRRRFDFIFAQRGAAYEERRFADFNQRYYEFIRPLILVRSVFAPSIELCGLIAIAVVLLAFIFGKVDLAGHDVIMIVTGLGLVFKPLKNLGEQATRLAETHGIVKKALAFLDVQHDSSLTHHTQMDPGARLASSQAIQIASLSVSVGGKSLVVGEGLTLRPGEVIAVVGETGSGKSSLLRSLAGLIEPTNWQSNYNWADLSADSTLVGQQPFLFRASLSDNLRYGSSGEISGDTLLSNLDSMALNDLEAVRSKKLNTLFNPLAQDISGGQLQRLTIARALCRNKRLLLFDEATSALDPELERVVFDVIKQRVGQLGLYCLYITHRPEIVGSQPLWSVADGKVSVIRDR